MTGSIRWIFLLMLGLGLARPAASRADDTNPVPDFETVYKLLRDNLPGTTDASLNRAAVDGLLAQLAGKVSLMDSRNADLSPAEILGQARLLEGNVAYLPVKRVTAGLPVDLKNALATLTVTNPVVGAVLDLRFAGGNDVADAATQARAIKELLNPVAILINGGTHDGAEALAAALHSADAGLIIGSATAGVAATFKELALPNGDRLRITLGSGSSTNRVQPDVAVRVNAADERTFMADPYNVPVEEQDNGSVNTNDYLPFIDHTSEADLVRAKIKDGDEDENTAAKPTTPPEPCIHDPVLARAVDLIKGLAALHPANP